MTDTSFLTKLAKEVNPRAILVPDTSVLVKNHDLAIWSVGRPCVVAISNLVLGELEYLKRQSEQKPDQARAANAVMATLAALTQARKLPRGLNQGLPINDGLWVVTIAIDRASLATGLDAKSNDQQIAGAAGLMQKELESFPANVPIVLLTADINQSVFAESVGIPAFLADHPFRDDVFPKLESLLNALREVPWSSPLREPLHHVMPARESIVTTFIGRREQLGVLFEWLMDDTKRKWALTGDGGKGKTAIAYEFGEEVYRAAPPHLQAVIWMSAKKRKFAEGAIRTIDAPDFSTLSEALDFLLDAFGDTDQLEDIGAKRKQVLSFLTELPSLLIVDDIDSITKENEDVVEFFLDDVLSTRSKILLTSRRHYPGMGQRETEIRGLEAAEADQFIRDKALEFGLDPRRFEISTPKILQATDGSPLYMEDLIRLCRVLSLDNAVRQWVDRRGEAARSYALEREVQELTRYGELDLDVLIACALIGRPTSAPELAQILGRAQEDIDEALEHLRQLYLVPQGTVVEDVVLFDVNRNTRSLVTSRYGKTLAARKITGALTALGKREKSHGERAHIAAVNRQAVLLVQEGRFDDAQALLTDLDIKLPNRPEILSQLGWVYKKWLPTPLRAEARELFERAHSLGSKSEDLYWHWAEMEELHEQWKRAIEVAELGLSRVGPTIRLSLRAASARFGYAVQLYRNLDRNSSVTELERVLIEARRGVTIPVTRPDRERYKSRLFEIGMQAAMRHPSQGPRHEILSLWEKELPTDPWLVRWKAQRL